MMAIRFRTLDALMLRTWLIRALFLFALFVVIAFVLVLFDELDSLREYHVPWTVGMAYILLQMPHEILKATPMVVVLSIMAAVSDMIRHNEILMLYVAGYSSVQLALPIAVALGILVMSLFFLYENVAGPASAKAQHLLEARIQGEQGGLGSRTGIWFPGSDNRIFYIENYFPYLHELRGVTILAFQGENRTLSERIDAEVARWQPQTGFWKMENVTARRLGPSGEMQRETVASQDYFLDCTPSDFERVTLDPEKMPHREIARLVEMIRAAGEDPRYYLSDLRIKEAFPFAVLFLGVLALGLALYIGGLGRASGLGLGLLLVVGYFMSLSIGKSLAHAAVIAPWLGAWYPNLLAAGGIVYLFRRLQRER